MYEVYISGHRLQCRYLPLPRGEIKRFYNDAMLGKNEMFHIMHMYCTCTYCREHTYSRVAAEVFSKGNRHRVIDKL